MFEIIAKEAKENGLCVDDLINAVKAVMLSRQGKASEADGFESNILSVTDELWQIAHDVADWLEYN